MLNPLIILGKHWFHIIVSSYQFSICSKTITVSWNIFFIWKLNLIRINNKYNLVQKYQTCNLLFIFNYSKYWRWNWLPPKISRKYWRFDPRNAWNPRKTRWTGCFYQHQIYDSYVWILYTKKGLNINPESILKYWKVYKFNKC